MIRIRNIQVEFKLPEKVVEEIREIIQRHAPEDVHISLYYESKNYKKVKK